MNSFAKEQCDALRRESAISASERLVAVAHLVSSLEHLQVDHDWRWGGFNNWTVSRNDLPPGPEPLQQLHDAVGEESATRALHVARVLAAMVLLAPGRTPLPRILAGVTALGTSRTLYRRHRYGNDGSDQMAFLVQVACTAARAFRRHPGAAEACLSFLAMQTALAYLVSGVAKLSSPRWRNGQALVRLLRTRTYGNATAHRWLSRHPALSRLCAAGVIALECGFPSVFARQGRYAPLLVSAAGCFHLVSARVMGLGRFFWTFTATYPVLLHVVRHRTPSRHRPAPNHR